MTLADWTVRINVLLSAGYAIVGETLSREGDRVYQTICAEPAPEGYIPPALSPAELAVGQKHFRMSEPQQKSLYAILIDKTLRTETYIRDTRRRAGQKTPEQDLLVVSLTALRNEI